MSQVDHRIQESIKTLAQASTVLKSPQRTPFLSEAGPQKIKIISQSLGDLELSTPQQSTLDELEEKWWETSRNPEQHSLTRKEEKQLCWIPSVVRDPIFRRRLYDSKKPMRTSYMNALMHSYHAAYLQLKDDAEFTEFLSNSLSQLQTHSNLCRSWYENSSQILGPNAHHIFGEALYTSEADILPRLKEFRLRVTTSTFAAMACHAALETLIKQLHLQSPDQLRSNLARYLLSDFLPENVRKKCISQILLNETVASETKLQHVLIDHLLGDHALGDPRVYAENWHGISVEAQGNVIKWLSTEDIQFFFDLVTKNKEDPHGRKRYWLQFAKSLRRARTFFSPADARRNLAQLQELTRQRRAPGQAKGQTSVFVMDFGSIVAVEFSETGNACFLYPSQIFNQLLPDFWIAEVSVSALKHYGKGTQYFSHDRNGKWCNAVTRALNQVGIWRK